MLRNEWIDKNMICPRRRTTDVSLQDPGAVVIRPWIDIDESLRGTDIQIEKSSSKATDMSIFFLIECFMRFSKPSNQFRDFLFIMIVLWMMIMGANCGQA